MHAATIPPGFEKSGTDVLPWIAHKAHTRMILFSSKNAGFGLAQTLIVAAIISVFVAMLFPAMSGIRSAARSAQCASNLRQVGVALNAYASDHGNRFPKVHSSKGGDPLTWMAKTLPYAGMPENSVGQPPLPRSAGIFVCPDFPKAAWEAREVSYRMNLAVVTVWQYDRTAMNPSGMFLIVETAGVNTDTFVVEAGEDVARRHPGKTANFLYADGHVENIREFVGPEDPRWGLRRD